jgi:formylglycine-generating enzyme required for sulfatase activity
MRGRWEATLGERRAAANAAKAAMSQARRATDELFQLVPKTAWYDRPVPERHRLIFYVGHLESFDWNLVRTALDVRAFHPSFDRLFAFGIDPHPGRLPEDSPSDWPSLEEVADYTGHIRDVLDTVLETVPPLLLHVAIEHRLMHAETFTYLLHNLAEPLSAVSPRTVTAEHAVRPCEPWLIDIPAGTATLGRERRPEADAQEPSGWFGWDNEFDAVSDFVPSFRIDKYKVTNRHYLAFVNDGARPPHFWRPRGSRWYWRTVFGEIPLPLEWPVYVTHDEARAYARWAGGALPSEAQFHRAAYGTPSGEERSYPWGESAPDSRLGNFNCERWDPVDVTATPLGDSAFGVAQLVGNGWEWTSTVFAPFPGFHPYAFYPGYSADFFDGEHVVLKGGSPRTAGPLLRRSFRNWFRPNYPYVYATFRCVKP